MEIKKLKPDFGKILKAWGVTGKTDTSVSEGSDYFMRSLRKTWKEIISGEDPYDIKENKEFAELIKTYSLQSSHNDLMFIAYMFIKRTRQANELREFIKSVPARKKELVYALRFLYSNELKDIKLVIRHKRKPQSVQVNNLLLVNSVRRALLEDYVEGDIDFKLGFISQGMVRDWARFFDVVIAADEAREARPRKLRQPVPESYIDIIHGYLQENTGLKAGKDVVISKDQILFMHSFLSMFSLIEEKDPWDAETLRQNLTRYREIKMKRFPIGYREFMKEYFHYF